MCWAMTYMPLVVRLMGLVSMAFAAAFLFFAEPLLAIANIPAGNPFFVHLVAVLGLVLNSTLVVASSDLVQYRVLLRYGVAVKVLPPAVMTYHLVTGNVTLFILVPLAGDLVMGLVCLIYLHETRPEQLP